MKWEYSVEKGIIGKYPSTVVTVERAKKQSGFSVWKEDQAQAVPKRARKRQHKDLFAVWEALSNEEREVSTNNMNVW